MASHLICEPASVVLLCDLERHSRRLAGEQCHGRCQAGQRTEAQAGCQPSERASHVDRIGLDQTTSLIARHLSNASLTRVPVQSREPRRSRGGAAPCATSRDAPIVTAPSDGRLPSGWVRPRCSQAGQEYEPLRADQRRRHGTTCPPEMAGWPLTGSRPSPAARESGDHRDTAVGRDTEPSLRALAILGTRSENCL